MKFDHFGKCRALPESERTIFNQLRASCGRHGPRSAGNKASVNSTAQYYHDAAVRMGLVDSSQGIRLPSFDNGSIVNPEAIWDPSIVGVPIKSVGSPAVPDGISALMIAASVRAALVPQECHRVGV